MTLPTLYLVTDPMCSWCWGMAADFEQARRQLQGQVAFDLMLGGINTHGTQPIGDYGRRFLLRLWREVEATTGQPFGYRFPAEYVHNSVLPCLAVEAMRGLTGQVPFAYLHNLQERFFVHGENINSEAVVCAQASLAGVSSADLQAAMAEPGLRERLRFQFEHAGKFGTQAMPSLLIQAQPDAPLALFAGGYVDAQMLVSLVQGHLG